MSVNPAPEILICPTNAAMLILDDRKEVNPVNERKVSFRLPVDLHAQLLEYCRQHQLRPSAVIRAALLAFFSQ